VVYRFDARAILIIAVAHGSELVMRDLASAIEQVRQALSAPP
jgi:hypothetical protein